MIYTAYMNKSLAVLIAAKTLKTLTFKFREDGFTTDRTVNVQDAQLIREGGVTIIMLSLEGISEAYTFYDHEAAITSQPQDRAVWAAIPEFFADEVLITW